MLAELDGPRTFTLHDQDGALCLAHWLDETVEMSRFVVPFSPSLLEKLRRCEFSVLDALDQPRVYLAEVDPNRDVRSVWLIQLADLPQESLPKAETMLYRVLK